MWLREFRAQAPEVAHHERKNKVACHVARDGKTHGDFRHVVGDAMGLVGDAMGHWVMFALELGTH